LLPILARRPEALSFVEKKGRDSGSAERGVALRRAAGKKKKEEKDVILLSKPAWGGKKGEGHSQSSRGERNSSYPGEERREGKIRPFDGYQRGGGGSVELSSCTEPSRGRGERKSWEGEKALISRSM